MKKLALTSLLAMFAFSGAHAANIIDGNPLYMPKAGHFYSETTVASHSEHSDTWVLGEEFGYGITDRLAIEAGTAVAEQDTFDHSEWGPFALGLTYRVLDEGAWKADVYGGYEINPVWGDHASFLDKDLTAYTWTAGVRGGYVAGDWTIAGHFAFEYTNTESFNWGDELLVPQHALLVGLDAQYVIDENWNLVAGVEYTGYTDDEADNSGSWTGTFGVNYNINPSAYIGAYIDAEMDHWKDNGEKGWSVEDGFGFGFKFGVDF
jgi:outer membrane protein W